MSQCPVKWQYERSRTKTCRPDESTVAQDLSYKTAANQATADQGLAAVRVTTLKASALRVFRLLLRPEPGVVDGDRALRRLLKIALRKLGLRCIASEQVRGAS
jgi:hypothetical protein